MISKQWRERLTYTAMSVFVAWHTLAIVIAPAPNNSVLVQSLRTVFQPYLSFFRLDNVWDFFAPNVGRGKDFRYVIEDAAGKRHAFVPSADLNWYLPQHLWFRARYLAIIEKPDRDGDLAVEFFCRKHAALHPVSIILQEYQEGDFLPDDHLSGKNPMDLEFVTVNTLKRAKCPDSQP